MSVLQEYIGDNMFPLERKVQPVLMSLRMSTRSLPMIAILGGSDLLALTLAGTAGVYLRLVFGGQYEPILYGQLSRSSSTSVMCTKYVQGSSQHDLRWI